MIRIVRIRPWAILLASFFAAGAVNANDVSVQVSLTTGQDVLKNALVRFTVYLPDALKDATTAKVTSSDGQEFVGQLTQPSLLANKANAKKNFVVRELSFVFPELKAKAQADFKVTFNATSQNAAPSFSFSGAEGKYSELQFDGRPVMRYMYESLDASTEERRMATYKVYHHVYDPRGKRFVTKGPGGLFPHHRGLFYGFNKITYGDGKKADVWHCKSGESQAHTAITREEVGPVLGRHLLSISWRGTDGEEFAREQREMTAYNIPGGTMIEFASILTTADGTITLKGDPQHAGFQFRAAQEVPDKTKHLTYYVRPDGKDKPGSFRNWPQDKNHVNLPWNALSFVLGEQRYTCCYLDSPNNPKESRFSERDYGRFGSYFEATVTKEQPLKINYRIWLQEGELDVDEIERIARSAWPATQHSELIAK